jgi:hypothetical protein
VESVRVRVDRKRWRIERESIKVRVRVDGSVRVRIDRSVRMKVDAS